MKWISLYLLFLCPLFAVAETSNLSNETELSIVQTGGNTSLETYNLKTETKYEFGKRIVSFGGHYTLGTGEVTKDGSTEKERVETARNWDVHARYEQVLSEKVNGFLGVQYEGDEFSGFKQRENVDLGGKYIFIKSKELNSNLEVGLRYTTERTVARDEDNEDVFQDNKGRAYYEISQVVSPSLSYKFWAEYISNFSRAEDYLINFEPSLAFVLSNTFSLKLAYKGMYDNEPATEGNEYLDWTYTTSLIAKF